MKKCTQIGESIAEPATQLSSILQNKTGGGTERNQTIDVIKGIGIVLMVWGHSGAPFYNFVYLFHMAIFFVCSGYCWNEKNIQNKSAVWKYILKKVKSLYIPFVLSNAFFHLLNNFWIKICIQPAATYLSSKKLAIEILKIFAFGGSTGFGGATWFFRTLFCISVEHLLLTYIIKNMKYKRFIFSVIVVLCAICAQLISSFDVKLPKDLQSCFAAYLAFLFGVYFRNLNLSSLLRYYRIIISSISFGILILLNNFTTIRLFSAVITNLLFYSAATICGWVMLWIIASFIPKQFKLLNFLGRHTMSIVIWHFLSFKLVSFLYVAVTKSGKALLLVFPVIDSVPFLWIAYAVTGICVPMLLSVCYEKLKTKASRVHI